VIVDSGIKSPVDIERWLRHTQLTTTINTCMHPVDARLSGAEVSTSCSMASGRHMGTTMGATNLREQPHIWLPPTGQIPHNQANNTIRRKQPQPLTPPHNR